MQGFVNNSDPKVAKKNKNLPFFILQKEATWPINKILMRKTFSWISLKSQVQIKKKHRLNEIYRPIQY